MNTCLDRQYGFDDNLPNSALISHLIKGIISRKLEIWKTVPICTAYAHFQAGLCESRRCSTAAA